MSFSFYSGCGSALAEQFALGLSCLLGFFAASFQNAATLSFGASAPDSVVDAVGEGVLEAAILDRALRTDPFRYFYPDAIAREEGFWGLVGAKPFGHPIRFHHGHLHVFIRVLRSDWAESSRKGRLLAHMAEIDTSLIRENGSLCAEHTLPFASVERKSLMSDTMEEQAPAAGHAKIVYNGPIAPHWEIRAISGDSALMDGFRDRVTARLLLLPPHDPQFRRNRERVNRDGERERIYIEWDLGYEETETPRS